MKAVILGIGQSSILTAKLLDEKGIDYRIVVRRSRKSVEHYRLHGINLQKIIYVMEITEVQLLNLKDEFDYTHVFNFAASSFVQDSKFDFEYFLNNNSKIIWNIFQLATKFDDLWLFHPLSSEMIYSQQEVKELGSIRLKPRNAYGLAKIADFHSTELIREETNLKVNSCIMFNHESKYRAAQFFTKKVISYFQNPKPEHTLKIYNSQSQRDWGSAAEFVEIIYQSAVAKQSCSTMLGTGTLMKVETFVDYCFQLSGFDYKKYEENGLLHWRSSRHQVTEISRSESDSKRNVKASLDLVEKSFGRIPKINGKNLITGLLKAEI